MPFNLWAHQLLEDYSDSQFDVFNGTSSLLSLKKAIIYDLLLCRSISDSCSVF